MTLDNQTTPQSQAQLTAADDEKRIQQVWETARSSVSDGKHEWIVISFNVVIHTAEDWLAGFGGHSCVLWAPQREDLVCGVGIAETLTASGAGRFESIRKQSEFLWPKLLHVPEESLSFEWTPQLFGGFAFSDTGASSAQWREFGSARFFLPRITYVTRGQQAIISLALNRNEVTEQPQGESFDLLRKALTQLRMPERLSRTGQSHPAQVVQSSDPGPPTYAGRVADIVQKIRQGEVNKIVTAREVSLQSAQAIDPLATAFALRAHAPHCLRFVFRFGESSFLGATPETLVRRSGRSLFTEALAGTMAGDLQQAEQRLAASAKDLQEHQWVAESIEKVLTTLCSEVNRPQQPQVRKLRHLLHLCTPIEGTLDNDVHVLSLVAALHPSPAVGGVPRELACAWIHDHEPFDRGWYSGIVGWFDRQGDGAFNVALRSGLANPQGIRLYAGAGVVRDSIPTAELDETTLKLTSLRAALRCTEL